MGLKLVSRTLKVTLCKSKKMYKQASKMLEARIWLVLDFLTIIIHIKLKKVLSGNLKPNQEKFLELKLRKVHK